MQSVLVIGDVSMWCVDHGELDAAQVQNQPVQSVIGHTAVKTAGMAGWLAVQLKQLRGDMRVLIAYFGELATETRVSLNPLQTFSVAVGKPSLGLREQTVLGLAGLQLTLRTQAETGDKDVIARNLYDGLKSIPDDLRSTLSAVVYVDHGVSLFGMTFVTAKEFADAYRIPFCVVTTQAFTIERCEELAVLITTDSAASQYLASDVHPALASHDDAERIMTQAKQLAARTAAGLVVVVAANLIAYGYATGSVVTTSYKRRNVGIRDLGMFETIAAGVIAGLSQNMSPDAAIQLAVFAAADGKDANVPRLVDMTAVDELQRMQQGADGKIYRFDQLLTKLQIVRKQFAHGAVAAAVVTEDVRQSDLEMLRHAKANASWLMVICGTAQARVIAEMQCVDAVLVDTVVPVESLLRSVKPDVLFRNSDIDGTAEAIAEAVARHGGEVVDYRQRPSPDVANFDR